MNTSVAALSLVTVLAFAGAAEADFLIPDGVNVPWTRGVSSPSAYGQWDVFTSAAGPNSPDVGQSVTGSLAAGAPEFNVSVTGATATLLGNGDIYSANSTEFVTVTVPSFGLGGGYTTSILLQVRTQGFEINPASVLINGVAPASVTELSRVSLGAQGAMVETAYLWNLPGSDSSYSIAFNGGPFFSLDRIAVDEFATVPTPGATVAVGLGTLAAVRRRR